MDSSHGLRARCPRQFLQTRRRATGTEILHGYSSPSCLRSVPRRVTSLRLFRPMACPLRLLLPCCRHMKNRGVTRARVIRVFGRHSLSQGNPVQAHQPLLKLCTFPPPDRLVATAASAYGAGTLDIYLLENLRVLGGRACQGRGGGVSRADAGDLLRDQVRRQRHRMPGGRLAFQQGGLGLGPHL